MITMGDEVRRTQHGNNNAYCHNDESVWLDWISFEAHGDVHRFTKLLIERRLLRDIGPERERMTFTQLIKRGLKGWHGVNSTSRTGVIICIVSPSVELADENLLVYFIFNAYWDQLEFELPLIANDETFLHRWIDTSERDTVDRDFGCSLQRLEKKTVLKSAGLEVIGG
jgi:glycogen operon protein